MSYNSQLVRDAKTRLPYVDAQTGIAQDHSHLMQNRLSRKRGALPGQVFSYPQRRWHRETRPVPVVQRGRLCISQECHCVQRVSSLTTEWPVVCLLQDPL